MTLLKTKRESDIGMKGLNCQFDYKSLASITFMKPSSVSFDSVDEGNGIHDIIVDKREQTITDSSGIVSPVCIFEINSSFLHKT